VKGLGTQECRAQRERMCSCCRMCVQSGYRPAQLFDVTWPHACAQVDQFWGGTAQQLRDRVWLHADELAAAGGAAPAAARPDGGAGAPGVEAPQSWLETG